VASRSPFVQYGLIGCLIFWLATVPDMRFGIGYILAAAMLGASVAFAVCFDQPRFAGYVPALVIASMGLLTIHSGLWRVRSDYFYAVVETPTYELRGPNGNRIFVPKASDRCWNHQLPCTPYFDPVALAKIKWPANWPVPPPGWAPDDITGVFLSTGVDDQR
jgi:hypothetical protein